jgi:hypothetical protein
MCQCVGSMLIFSERSEVDWTSLRMRAMSYVTERQDAVRILMPLTPAGHGAIAGSWW